MSNEQVVYSQSPSQILNFYSYIVTLLVSAVIIFIYIQYNSKLPWYFLLLLIYPFAKCIWNFLKIKCTKYELTNERLIIVSGVINRKTAEIELYRVKDTTMEEPFYYRIFGLGNIKLITSDKSLPEYYLDAMPNAKEFREKMRELVEDLRVKKNVRELDFE